MNVLYTDSVVNKLSDFFVRNKIFVSACIPRTGGCDQDCSLKEMEASKVNYKPYSMIILFNDMHEYVGEQITFDHKINRGTIYDLSIIKNIVKVRSTDIVKTCPSGSFSENYNYEKQIDGDSDVTSEGTSCGTSEDMEGDDLYWYVEDKPTYNLFPMSLYNKRKSFTHKKIKLRISERVVYGENDIAGEEMGDEISSTTSSFFDSYVSSSSEEEGYFDDNYVHKRSECNDLSPNKIFDNISPGTGEVLSESSTPSAEVPGEEVEGSVCLVVYPSRTKKDSFDINRYDKTGISVILDFENKNFVLYDSKAIDWLEY